MILNLTSHIITNVYIEIIIFDKNKKINVTKTRTIIKKTFIRFFFHKLNEIISKKFKRFLKYKIFVIITFELSIVKNF